MKILITDIDNIIFSYLNEGYFVKHANLTTLSINYKLAFAEFKNSTPKQLINMLEMNEDTYIFLDEIIINYEKIKKIQHIINKFNYVFENEDSFKLIFNKLKNTYIIIDDYNINDINSINENDKDDWLIMEHSYISNNTTFMSYYFNYLVQKHFKKECNKRCNVNNIHVIDIKCNYVEDQTFY